MHSKIKKTFLFFFFLKLSLFTLPAQTSPGSISGAMGGAGHSSIDAGESYILNPSSVAHLRGAAITFGTNSYSSSSKENETTTPEGWHLSLNENGSDSIFGTSIYLSKTHNRLTSPTSYTSSLAYNDAWLTIGNFILPYLSAGISYHFHETQTPLQEYQEHNGGIGFLWTPFDVLGIGLSFQNLRSPPKDIPAHLTLGSTSGIGLLYLHKNYLRLRLDYTRKIHKLPSLSFAETAFGMENSITPWLLARIGVAQQISDERARTQKLTFGIGFSGPRFGINYAFQQYQLAQSGQEHGIDLTIPF